MIKAYPINDKGEKIGPAKNIPDHVWANLERTRGKKKRWVIATPTDVDSFETNLPGKLTGPNTKQLADKPSESTKKNQKKKDEK